MPGDLKFAIVMLFVCIIMIIWMLYDFFNKVKDESLAMGLAFWITIMFFGAIICGVRIAAWY